MRDRLAEVKRTLQVWQDAKAASINAYQSYQSCLNASNKAIGKILDLRCEKLLLTFLVVLADGKIIKANREAAEVYEFALEDVERKTTATWLQSKATLDNDHLTIDGANGNLISRLSRCEPRSPDDSLFPFYRSNSSGFYR